MTCLEIHYEKNRATEVKNLGYLIAKLNKVGAISFNTQLHAEQSPTRPMVSADRGLLTVFYANGDVHQSTWMSYDLLLQWVGKRRNLRGVRHTYDSLPVAPRSAWLANPRKWMSDNLPYVPTPSKRIPNFKSNARLLATVTNSVNVTFRLGERVHASPIYDFYGESKRTVTNVFGNLATVDSTDVQADAE